MAGVLCTVKLRAPEHFEDYFHVAAGQMVYSFGGAETDYYLNVYVFNTVSLKWTKVFPRDDTCYKDHREVPCMHWSSTGVLIDNVIYIWGGQKNLGLRNNVLYAFDVDTHAWINAEVSGTVPEARSYHSACVCGKVMYVHGGETMEGRRTNDVYKLDTSSMVWSFIESGGTAPPASSSHSATVIGTKMFVFGGLWWNADYPNLRVFDTETDNWLSMPSAQPLPEGQYSPSAFAYNGELYICGTDTDDVLDDENGVPITIHDLLKFSPETLSWRKVKPKGNVPFTMFGGSCCVVGDRVVVFGYDAGTDDASAYVSVYILDFSPSLKTLCMLSVLRYGLEQSELPHHIREELAAMTMTEDLQVQPKMVYD